MKKGIGVLLLFACIFCFTIFNLFWNNSLTLIDCFKSTGAEFQRIDIEGCIEFETKESVSKVAIELFKGLNENSLEQKKESTIYGIGNNYLLEEENNMATLSYSLKAYNVEIKTRKLKSENYIYASVKLSQYSDKVNITNIRRRISNAFSYYKVKPSFSSLIQGKYNTELSVPQMREKAIGVYKGKNVSHIDGINEGNIVSYSGYIKGIGDKICYLGNWVNLNTALRYSKSDGCTYIWMGSPIILIEY